MSKKRNSIKMDLCRNSNNNNNNDGSCTDCDTGSDVAGDDGESKQMLQIICKKPFVFKNKENGNLLTIHHTEFDGSGKKRVPFWCVCFNDFNDIIVSIDSRGNTFVFDVKAIEFWRHSNAIENGSAARFLPKSRNIIIYATKDGDVGLLNIDTGTILHRTQISNTKIKRIIFSTSTYDEKPAILLCSTNAECILCKYDSQTIQPQQKLFDVVSIQSINALNLTIKSVDILPAPKTTTTTTTTVISSQIIALLNDDSIHIWHEDTSVGTEYKRRQKLNFELIKRLHPIKQRDQYLQQHHKVHEIQRMHFINDLNGKSLGKHFIDNLIADYSNGLISFICFTCDGDRMVIGTIDDNFMIFEVAKWAILSVFGAPGIGLKTGQFLTVGNQFTGATGSGKKNKCILNVNTVGERAIFLELASDQKMKIFGTLDRVGIVKQTESTNGNLLGLICNNGKVYIHNLAVVLKNMTRNWKQIDDLMNNNIKRYSNEQRTLGEQAHSILSPNRLKTILAEYGEYPTKYRRIIWKAILQLPDNTKAFTELLKKGTHPSCQSLDQSFPLRDVATMRNLKKILSCLAHWCRAFSQYPSPDGNQMDRTSFLPAFIFPFVKLFENNSIAAFETIATILFNQCQLWFEFSPLEPINYLGMIENILTHFEPALMQFYKTKSVTVTTYAWKTLTTAFTEVLDDRQWYQLWDNVVSNPSDFLLFAIVAYNIVQKNVIMRLGSKRTIEKFFDEQNNIDMKMFIRKIYLLNKNCPEQLHPSKYMHNFQSMQIDQYQKMLNYPKVLVNVRNTQMDTLRNENKIFNQKIHELEKMEQALVDRLTNDWRKEEHERRLKTVQQLYAEALLREEERIAYQRKQLLLYQRQLKDRECEIMDAVQQGQQERVLHQREDELTALLNEIEQNKIREETDIICAEEYLRGNEMFTLINETNLREDDEDTLAIQFQQNLQKLKAQRLGLKHDLAKLSAAL